MQDKTPVSSHDFVRLSTLVQAAEALTNNLVALEGKFKSQKDASEEDDKDLLAEIQLINGTMVLLAKIVTQFRPGFVENYPIRLCPGRRVRTEFDAALSHAEDVDALEVYDERLTDRYWRSIVSFRESRTRLTDATKAAAEVLGLGKSDGGSSTPELLSSIDELDRTIGVRFFGDKVVEQGSAGAKPVFGASARPSGVVRPATVQIKNEGESE